MSPRGLALVAVAALVFSACDPAPSAAPSNGRPASPLPSPSSGTTSAPGTPAPSATVGPAAEFPLAVVTGIRNLQAVVTLDEVAALATAGDLTLPCGIELR